MKIVAVSGVGDLDQRAALFAWTGILAIGGLIFWATLRPPRLAK